MRLYTLILVGDCFIDDMRQATDLGGLSPLPAGIDDDLAAFESIALGPDPIANTHRVGKAGERVWMLNIAEIPET